MHVFENSPTHFVPVIVFGYRFRFGSVSDFCFGFRSAKPVTEAGLSPSRIEPSRAGRRGFEPNRAERLECVTIEYANFWSGEGEVVDCVQMVNESTHMTHNTFREVKYL